VEPRKYKTNWKILFLILNIMFLINFLKSENRALLIGIENYNHPAINLKGPTHDIDLMEKIALKMGFKTSQIKKIVNSDATRIKILATFRDWLIKGVGPEDKIFFYFSGHGTQIEDKNSDEDDGCDEALVPYDLFIKGSEVLISDDEMGGLFKQIKAGQKLIVIDSCHSGTATRHLQSPTVKGFSSLGKLLIDHNCSCNQPVNRRSIQFFPERNGDRLDYISMTSADQNEIAQSSLTQGEGSLFTQTLYNVIEKDGLEISFKELRNRVESIIKQRCKTANIPPQTPQLDGNPAWYSKKVRDFGLFPLNQQKKPEKEGHSPIPVPSLKSTLSKKPTALIIGNADYAVGKLRNPVNDARLVRSILKKLGFDIIYGENLNLREMKERLMDFGEILKKKGGVGLFYFAGHGVQIKGTNYLLPIGVKIRDEADVEFEGFQVARVTSKLELCENNLNIIILDACRNNPFAYSFKRSYNRGLAQMSSGKGMLIAYATAPGNIALDGPGMGNGLFTYYLIKTIEIPGLSLERVFTITRQKVYQESKQQQLPWVSTSVLGDFKFNPIRIQSKNIVNNILVSRDRGKTPSIRKPGSQATVRNANLKDEIFSKNSMARWQDWQNHFEENVKKLKYLDIDPHITAVSKKEAWKQVQTVFHQNNPYSRHDDQLRKYIDGRVEFWTDSDQFGYIIVSAIPFAQLIIDGKNYGSVPPIKTVKIKTGKHQVSLNNLETSIREIDVEAGKCIGIYHFFPDPEREK